MQMILIFSAFIACFSAFVILFMTKIGFREYVEVNGSKLLSELFSCDFCLSFWTGLIITVFIVAFTGDFSLFLCAVITPPITRILI